MKKEKVELNLSANRAIQHFSRVKNVSGATFEQKVYWEESGSYFCYTETKVIGKQVVRVLDEISRAVYLEKLHAMFMNPATNNEENSFMEVADFQVKNGKFELENIHLADNSHSRYVADYKAALQRQEAAQESFAEKLHKKYGYSKANIAVFNLDADALEKYYKSLKEAFKMVAILSDEERTTYRRALSEGSFPDKEKVLKEFGLEYGNVPVRKLDFWDLYFKLR